MINSFQSQIHFMRLFRCVESTFADSFAINTYLSPPFSLMRRYAKKTRFISFCWLAHILKIFKSRYCTQISKRIILLVSVFMIYVFNRPLAGHIQPSKSMRQSFLIIYRDSPVAGICRATRYFSYKIQSVFMSFPDKNTCQRIIVKNITDMVSYSHELAFTIGAR